MSLGTRRSGRRIATPVRRHRRRVSSDEPVIMGEEPAPGGGCIDLTADDEQNASIVDLTNTPINEIPAIVIGSQSPPGRPQPRRRPRPAPRRRRRGRSAAPAGDVLHNDTDGSDVEALPDIPFDLGVSIPFVPSLETGAQQLSDANPSTSTGKSVPYSPPGKSITCPVCLENAREIRASGNKLMSTTCGHVFCNTCIKGAIKSQQKCPNCRKKLTLKQIHPLFI